MPGKRHSAGPIAAVFGGIRGIDFSADGFTVNPLVVSSSRMVLLNSSLISSSPDCANPSEQYLTQGKSVRDRTQDLREMLTFADEAQRILQFTV